MSAITVSDCPKCKKVFLVAELKKQQGAFVGKMPLEEDEEDRYQVDYLCPECGKVLLCDTSGRGNLVPQQSDEQIAKFHG